MRGAACCVLRSGLARVFALRAGARGVPLVAARDEVREHARRARHGLQCAWNCAVRMMCAYVGREAFMCALPVCLAHRERADPCNARVARSVVRARRRGAVPVELAMGSWERSHWGLLPPWETY